MRLYGICFASEQVFIKTYFFTDDSNYYYSEFRRQTYLLSFYCED